MHSLLLDEFLAGAEAAEQAEILGWWATLSAVDQAELAVLSSGNPIPAKSLSIPADSDKADDVVDDYYEFFVNHELAPHHPFHGWPRVAPAVTVIPLLSPHWPPYEAELQSQPWRPGGELSPYRAYDIEQLRNLR